MNLPSKARCHYCMQKIYFDYIIYYCMKYIYIYIYIYICNQKSEKRPVCFLPYFIPGGTADPPGVKQL